MPIATYFFIVSLAGLLTMGVSKSVSLDRNRPGMFSFLSKYDVRLGALLIRSSESMKRMTISLRENAALFARTSGHFITVLLHQILQSAERRVRAWREFARERKIERRSASSFIKDVFEYNNQIKDKRDL